MKLTHAFQWLALVSASMAYSVSGGHVSLNKAKAFDVNPKSSDVNRLTLDSPRDVLDISINIKGDQPHQLVLLFSDEKGLDHAVFPQYTVGKASAKVPVSKIPNALKLQDRIFVSLVAASASGKNVNQKVVELIPSQLLQSSVEQKKVTRLGAKPEIHHVFRKDVDTVGAFLPVVFSGLAVALLAALLASWAITLNGELFGARDASTWKAGYLATLAMFEFTFAKYYLGSSIFSTLFQGAALAGPLIFFGSRSLSALARARA